MIQYGTKARTAIVASAIAVLAVFYFVFDPSTNWWVPRCLFHTLTGLDCPGCGSQRALHAILHGKLAEAASFNLMVFPALAYLLLLGLCEFSPRRLCRLHAALTSLPAIIVMLAAIIAWWVIRNL